MVLICNRLCRDQAAWPQLQQSLRLLLNCPVSSSNEKAAECHGTGTGPLQAGCRAAMKVGSGEGGVGGDEQTECTAGARAGAG